MRILEEIALTCWHGDGRTTTVAEIEAQCKSSRLTRTLQRFQENFQQESGGCITRLLTAFYFRASGDVRESSKRRVTAACAAHGHAMSRAAVRETMILGEVVLVRKKGRVFHV